jgi:histidyl-tRNA synthetase
MKAADRLGSRFVVLAGPEELADREVTVRDMASKAEWRVSLDRVEKDLAVALSGV